MTGDDRTVQVPVSLIKELRRYLNGDSGHFDFSWLFTSDMNHAFQDAEPACGVPSPHNAHRVDPAPGDDFFDCAGTATYWHDPESPRIEDMAPGTTFALPVRWEVGKPGAFSGRPIVHMVGTSTTLYLDRIDPSTIRDVTPPAVTS